MLKSLMTCPRIIDKYMVVMKKKLFKLLIVSFLLIGLLIVISLSLNKSESYLDDALILAGDNRVELEAVLKHYQQNKKDSLKYKAACFLITNMPYHYSYTSERLQKYYKTIDSINIKNNNVDICLSLYDSLKSELGNPNENLVRIEDVKIIKADYLINSIDHAFRQWEKGYWATHLSFDEFCEYLLPYRVGYENVEEWRDELEERYLWSILWMKDQDEKRNSSYWAALYMNDQLKKRGFVLRMPLPESVVEPPITILKNMRMGSCEDYARHAVYVMRACGIPVGMDFTPQWPFRSHSHSWNVLLENRGRNIPFMGGESNPGYPNKTEYKLAKVYRYTFAYQHQSLYAQKGNEEVPEQLDTPFIRDVSSEYIKGVDLYLKISQKGRNENRFVYLSVFDNQNWIPVEWSKMSSSKVRFSCMGRDIVYLPTFYENYQIVPATYPLLVRANGESNYLIPDMQNLDTLKLKRKFPIFSGVLGYSSRLVGGWFEAANDSTFRDPVLIGKIDKMPLMCLDSLKVGSLPDTYRYWRYISPQYGHCNIAEIEFRFSGKKLPTHDKQLISDGKIPSYSSLYYAFDNDPLTFYEASEASYSWIGVDFGTKVSVDKIQYLPRNDDNNVTPGHVYELFYFNENGPQSLGQKIAEGYSIEYTNVPSKALYLLKDLTRGTEERIFTYEEGRQIWW